MPTPDPREYVRSLVLQAHRRLYLARRQAEAHIPDEGLAEDLFLLEIEAHRMARALERKRYRSDSEARLLRKALAKASAELDNPDGHVV